MVDLFSTPAEHALTHHELDAVEHEAGPSSIGDAAADLSIEEAYEVEDTVKKILEGAYKTIGLQFPDELLPCAVPVYRAIQQRIAPAQAYVLADSTYGSCCPDVLSCLHLPADFLIHYGHACLTPTDALPVHYVFPRRTVDVKHAVGALQQAREGFMEKESRKGVVVVWDVAYDWAADDLMSTISSQTSFPASFARIRRQSRAPASSPATQEPSPILARAQGKAPALRSTDPPEGLDWDDCVIWYIGEEGRALLNLQMTHSTTPILVYSPPTRAVTALTTSSRLLQRRLLSIHTAVTSDVFGLVVHSVGLKSSKPLLDELRRLLKKARKKSYTLTVGRINPAKLANFDSIEVFVIIGCNEGGLVDSKEFFRPIITPYELLLALQGPEHAWEPGRWTLDMSKVLHEAQKQQPNGDRAQQNGDDERDEEAPVFNLVTGKYKSRRTFGNGEAEASVSLNGIKDLTLRNQQFSLAKLESAGSTYLSSRSFQGLEVRYGMDEPAQLEQGRGGIAKGYSEEQRGK